MRGAILLCAIACAAASMTAPPSPFGFGPSSTSPPVHQAALSRFGDLKLGMFMHHGPVTQWGSAISWPLVCLKLPCTVQTARKPGDTMPTTRNITTVAELRHHRQQYRDLAHSYDPVGFNATHIARAAKQAGFRYLVYTTVHCDGFANWDSDITPYNIMHTPYGKDIFGELAAALRKEGLLVGAYVCPTLWNDDDFWWPDALSAVGVAESPTYNTTESPARWDKYLATLHGMVQELAEKYAPDLFWFDCHDTPPTMDTMLEQLVAPIREANPSALVLVRNGVFSDYAELVDKSEAEAELVLGQVQARAGTQFEAPDTLQSSGLWAFDPTSAQRPVGEMLANLALMASKGGNYLINVGPGPDGGGAASATSWLARMAAWMDVNMEALFDGAMPMDPYEVSTNAGIAYFMSKARKTVNSSIHTTATSSGRGVDVYVLIPTVVPKADAILAAAAARPTGQPRKGAHATRQAGVKVPSVEMVLDGGRVMLTTFRSALLSPGVVLDKVELLGCSGRVKFTQFATGLELDATGVIPSPPPQHLLDGAVFKLRFVVKGKTLGL